MTKVQTASTLIKPNLHICHTAIVTQPPYRFCPFGLPTTTNYNQSHPITTHPLPSPYTTNSAINRLVGRGNLPRRILIIPCNFLTFPTIPTPSIGSLFPSPTFHPQKVTLSPKPKNTLIYLSYLFTTPPLTFTPLILTKRRGY